MPDESDLFISYSRKDDVRGFVSALHGLLPECAGSAADSATIVRRLAELPAQPEIATLLNNLARLLQDTNRLGEAEPLMRRMVLIFLRFTVATGHPHPHLLDALNNYASLLQQSKGEQPPGPGILSLGPESGMEAGRFQAVLAQAFGG